MCGFTLTFRHICCKQLTANNQQASRKLACKFFGTNCIIFDSGCSWETVLVVVYVKLGFSAFGIWKSIRPVTIVWRDAYMDICLWHTQMFRLWSSWYNCHPLFLASLQMHNVDVSAPAYPGCPRKTTIKQSAHSGPKRISQQTSLQTKTQTSIVSRVPVCRQTWKWPAGRDCGAKGCAACRPCSASSPGRLCCSSRESGHRPSAATS